MSTINEIPLSPRPERFLISLAGVPYQLTLRWCPPAAAWVLNIADDAGNPIVSGIPLVTGSDLLAQYQYLGIGGALYVQSDDSVYGAPTANNLGTISHLYFVTP